MARTQLRVYLWSSSEADRFGSKPRATTTMW